MREGYGAEETVNFTASFVQNLRYRLDDEEYPNYPVETLVDKAGDCEDTAILAAALLDAMGYDTVLIRFTSAVEGEAGHMAVGVAVTGVSGGCSYRYDGRTYYYLETTSTSWEWGRCPRMSLPSSTAPATASTNWFRFRPSGSAASLEYRVGAGGSVTPR